MTRNTIRSAMMLATGAMIVVSGPASADVKAGVDAWTVGDYARAVEEWVEPAANGDPDAQFNLAQAYRLGRGVDVDLKQAELLYARAAAQGHVRSADNYGLMLFQDGRHAQAMPYIEAAAGRGDPRAQYLMGIAHFNGDNVTKDWRRAYALMTLANATGLPQAKSALAQMDEYIPLEDRQAAQPIATMLRAQADAARQRQLAAVDLALEPDGWIDDIGEPAGSYSAEWAATNAGAEYTLPAQRSVTAPHSTAAGRKDIIQPMVAPATSDAAVSGGLWKVQLGTFRVAANADRMWRKVGKLPALKGANEARGAVGQMTVLYAAGFASQDAASKACDALKSAGHSCLVTR